MSFLSWAALAVGLLVVAPVLAHLLRRRPPEQQEFAATALVPKHTAVAHRRAAIEDRGLFALRAASILALAVLGATPFVRCSRLSLARPQGASVALAIVVDDSLSMRAPREPGAATSRFERAREAALELADGLQPGDAVAVILAGKPARIALAMSANVGAASEVLRDVQPSDRGSDVDGAIRIASELLAKLGHVDKRVVVLSDMADPQLDEAQPYATGIRVWLPLPELQGWLPDCGVVQADRSANQVSVRIACGERPSDGPDGATGSATAASSASPAPATSAAAAGKKRHIEIRAANEVLIRAPLPLDRTRIDTSLSLPDGTLEKHKGVQLYAALSGTDSIAENDITPVVALGGQLRVGLVSDSAESRVATGGAPPVEQALRALRLGVQLAPLAAVPDSKSELASYGLLIVDDAAGFTPAQRRGLEGWLQQGGVLLMTLGPNAAAAPLGSGFAPVVPGVVRWERSAPAGIDLASDTFFGEAATGLEQLGAKGRARLDLDSGGALTSLAKWSDGVPFLQQHKLGRGVAYLVNVPFSTEHSDFALRPGILALLARAVDSARTLGGASRSPVGSSWEFETFKEVSAEFIPAGDDRKAEDLELERRNGTLSLIPARLGLYGLTLDGTRAQRVASLDAAEVDLRPRQIDTAEAGEELGGSEATVDISAQIAVLLLLLFAGEMAVRVLRPRQRAGSGGNEDPPASAEPASA